MLACRHPAPDAKLREKTMRILLTLCLLLPWAAVAQDEAPETPVAPPKPCATEQHRQFDFWLGEWDVTQGDKPAGQNRIETAHGGCVLTENWTSASGNFSGRSLNLYDQANDRWHQTWVDTTGTLLQLDGGLEDGSMVLSGQRPGSDGGQVTHRITWTPNDDGSVRQHWETSADGVTWVTAFDGLYAKASGGE